MANTCAHHTVQQSRSMTSDDPNEPSDDEIDARNEEEIEDQFLKLQTRAIMASTPRPTDAVQQSRCLTDDPNEPIDEEIHADEEHHDDTNSFLKGHNTEENTKFLKGQSAEEKMKFLKTSKQGSYRDYPQRRTSRCFACARKAAAIQTISSVFIVNEK